MLIEIKSLKDIKGYNYIIYKHSLTCPVSFNAKNKINAFEKAHQDIPVYMCVVQTTEDLKWEIQDKYGIDHESPQAIIVRDGKVIATEHHYGIQQLEKFFE